MLTMTSLAAQNQFGALIDSSQRQPVTVTRHGRPVSVVMSFADYQARAQTIPFNIAAMIGEHYPLRGEAAGESMRQHLATMGKLAEDDGLSEDDVMTLLNDD